jgi:hypothetical protein
VLRADENRPEIIVVRNAHAMHSGKPSVNLNTCSASYHFPDWPWAANMDATFRAKAALA